MMISRRRGISAEIIGVIGACLRSKVTYIFVIGLALMGCHQDQKDTAQDNSASSEAATSKPVYTPHPAYAPSTNDPLKALYGGQDPSSANRGLTPQALLSMFKEMKDLSIAAPLPKSWRTPLRRLKGKVKAKVSGWSYLERTRMERGKRDQEISITLKVWGKKSKVNHEVLTALRDIKALKNLPKRWGDRHTFVMKSHHTQLISKRSASLANDHPTNPTVLATFEVEWTLNHPQPSGKLRNCRYVHGLSPSIARGFPKWAAQHLKSVSTRRFVEWKYELSQSEELWRATWIYRNGEMHDLALTWWVKKLEAQGATRTSSQNLEQTWSLPQGGEISWWPETNPDPMGCEIAGGLITFEGRTPQSTP